MHLFGVACVMCSRRHDSANRACRPVNMSSGGLQRAGFIWPPARPEWLNNPIEMFILLTWTRWRLLFVPSRRLLRLSSTIATPPHHTATIFLCLSSSFSRFFPLALSLILLLSTSCLVNRCRLGGRDQKISLISILIYLHNLAVRAADAFRARRANKHRQHRPVLATMPRAWPNLILAHTHTHTHTQLVTGCRAF
ncbi:unnamed protein product [Protopolystoma xenopodis]|uniref:Uncharacterized protein n=1 Tax=Protopolystoma xenopodis TaxID=117903 RepID=A0A3S5A4L8_9PLAT|nr:unnamed protein product [Protopolystoma xenopodis]